MGYYNTVIVAPIDRPDIAVIKEALNMDASPSFEAKTNITAAKKAINKTFPAAWIEGFEATGDPTVFRVLMGGMPSKPTKPGAPVPPPKLGTPPQIVMASLHFSFDRK